ncbi:DNA methyltransferase (plasmid) [Nostoc cf. commune SO-36]|uniref:site-specific DNA-methyltransferase (adenine-specific) n=1 Tax=Nostoc cf. commune SO-36 TaxID=449208 RepID=A0ABM7ZCK3_NOSCO|nr:type ISP restriction/modification enzyme [Nostoc commune]BDI21050.1 DNA methyltransferase [Nostoc cf. commune SO-36]
MTFNQDNSYAFMVGTEDDRVEALKELLGYPVLQHDPEGSNFWYLRPGEDENKALETCPIAVGFYSELNKATDKEIKKLLTSQEKQQEIYGHYSGREFEQQPVMYLLLPGETQAGRVAMVLPEDEKRLRQRQIQTFAWDEEDLQARLARLQQESLLRTNRNRIENKPLLSIPLVEWVFYPSAKTARQLAQQLAKFALQMEQAIKMMGNNLEGYLNELFQSFKRELLPELKPSLNDEKGYSFADIYAQTITYGLFTARVFSHIRNPELKFDIQNVWEKLPETNPFLKQLFKAVFENQKQIEQKQKSGDELTDTIGQIVLLLNAANMDAILSDFQHKRNQEDIVIRFYEDFLAAYKPQMRERRGVYYTPEPVVSYIVRSIDHILKIDFGLTGGLADATKIKLEKPDSKGITETHKVLITDIATGTGTFLYSVIDHIYNSLKLDKDEWSNYVSQHLLPRLLGFELLMAPYAVAHMKLGLQLAELGYKFDTLERLRVYLTNTLQDAFQIPPTDELDNWIRDEADAANKIKQEAPVMVVMGNPPYSGVSANNGTWISDLLKGKDSIKNQSTSNYFEADGKPLGERKNWLNDDYVKFIRFAQWRIEQTGYGVLAFITNHGYMDNPTFRGMRQSLMTTFDDIYVLDLHGNSKKKEQSLNGSKDENVFDIQQGVAISIFVKRQNAKQQLANVYHTDLYGLRENKYQWLKKNSITTTQWTKLKPQSPFYLFVPHNTNWQSEYECNWKVTEIFPINSTGIVTARDNFVFDFDKKSLLQRITEFRNSQFSDQLIREKYFNGKGSSKYPDGDTRGWKLPEARRKVQADPDWEKRVLPCLYRPFDIRHLYYTEWMVDWHRYQVMRHMLESKNIGFHICRQISINEWGHILATNLITDDSYVSNKTSERGYTFPLYLYPQSNSLKELEEPLCPNFSQGFLNAIIEKLGYTPTPEAIFYYIYAIFHSPTYRTRYAEFLKIDFPRVPLTSDDELFHQLATYGEELVSLHLMKSPQLDNFITKFVENDGNNLVDAAHPKYNQDAVIINKKGDKFTGVPEEVWNFYVGGYQVCQKWLKDRKGRQLTDDDIQHYQRIVVALQQTIKLMNKIDQAIPGFPIQ